MKGNRHLFLSLRERTFENPFPIYKLGTETNKVSINNVVSNEDGTFFSFFEKNFRDDFIK